MLKDILAISGEPGLFKLVSQAKNGIIVEHLENKKRMPAYATAKISALEDIAIFTEEDEVALHEVFKKIHTRESGGEALSHKSSSNELKAYFQEVLPDFDKERVYVSDIKKVLNWYNILQKLEMLDFSKVEEKEEKESLEETAEEVEKVK